MYKHLQGSSDTLVVDHEDVQDHSLQRISGDQPMMGSQQSTLVVTPCFHLQERTAVNA